MEIALRIIVGVLLVAHGLVHLLWFVRNDDPKWPFRQDQSKLVPEQARGSALLVLVALTVSGFVLLGPAVWGVPGLAAIWPALAIAAAAASLLMLVAFWNTQLIFGVLIDVALIVLAIWRPEWTARIG